jgi:hypothetical protein
MCLSMIFYAKTKLVIPKNFFNMTVDFLFLGGGSLIFGLLISKKLEQNFSFEELSLVAMYIGYFINNPHFANSYQIFYGNFLNVLKKENYSILFKIRYFVAGIFVPVSLTSFFIWCAINDDIKSIGYSVNAMYFFVGWHYVKQGYGIFIVESVLKKSYWGAIEKKVFLVNSYVTWIYFWVLANTHETTYSFWGISSSNFRLPVIYSQVLQVGVIATSAASAFLLIWRCWKRWGRQQHPLLPLNGLLAYATSLYIWMAPGMNPIFVLFIPAFHSLQYLAVVWRYEINYLQDETEKKLEKNALINRRRSFLIRFSIFVGVGLILGYLFFWGIPQYLDAKVEYNKTVFGTALFLFCSWIFINIHHYFIDNVIWRRENPLVKKYLFGTA